MQVFASNGGWSSIGMGNHVLVPSASVLLVKAYIASHKQSNASSGSAMFSIVMRAYNQKIDHSLFEGMRFFP